MKFRNMFNRKIFSTMIYRNPLEYPRYVDPNMKQKYIQVLDKVNNDPHCNQFSFDSICSNDIWKTLVNFSYLDIQAKPKVKGRPKEYMFFLTPDGLNLLNEAYESKWLYDLIDFIESTKTSCIEEFELNVALYGMQNKFDTEIYPKISSLNEDFYTTTIFNKINKVFKRIKGLDVLAKNRVNVLSSQN